MGSAPLGVSNEEDDDLALGWPATVIAVFYAYFDESGTHRPDFTVLGGCVGTAHQFTLLHYEWRKLLDAHKIEHYHARKLGWNSDTNQSFILAAAPIIKREIAFTMTVALRNAEHNEYKKAPGAKQYHHSHYGLCFHVAMSGTLLFVTRQFPNEQVSFVLDDGNSHAGDVLRIFQSTKGQQIRGKDVLFANSLGGIAFKSDLFALQVADLISGVAYHDLLEGKFKSTKSGRLDRNQRVLLDAHWYENSRRGLDEMQAEKRRYQESRKRPARSEGPDS